MVAIPPPDPRPGMISALSERGGVASNRAAFDAMRLAILSSAGSCQRILLLDLQRAILKPRRRPSQACRPPRAVLIQAHKERAATSAAQVQGGKARRTYRPEADASGRGLHDGFTPPSLKKWLTILSSIEAFDPVPADALSSRIPAATPDARGSGRPDGGAVHRPAGGAPSSASVAHRSASTPRSWRPRQSA